MANLIIKPQNTSGDKVIIQDQAGVAVLTTADSGISSIKFTSGSAPGSPAKGAIYYDNSESTLKHYDGTKWVPLAAAAKATGGSTYAYSSYTVHAFTTSGTFTVTSGTLACDVLVVAGGGGGGGGAGGGGGGAGGILYNSASNSTIGNAAVSLSGSYTVTIGRGGAWGDGYDQSRGESGGNSIFTNGTLTYTAVGGGGGGGASETQGGSGGSGGGGRYNVAGGAGTSGQGYAGAHGKQGHTVTGGGGGGASGTPAQPAGNQSGRGDGGGGIDYSSKYGTMYGAPSTNVGSATPNGWFGGGGGSGSETARPGYGGNGGGAEGAYTGQSQAYNGVQNTGGGGGGSYNEPAEAGSGGSGIVLIRYST